MYLINHETMKKIITVLLILLACLPESVDAQYYLPENTVWAMGNQSGLDFSGPEPVPIQTGMLTGEGCASVCDGTGSLLFYTNGSRAWNAAGAEMPNGADITGAGPGSSISATQGAVIVPGMERCGIYYIFSLATDISGTGFYCSRVDMNLSNGQGDVDTTYAFSKVRLKGSVSEKMTAIKGRENDVWIVIHADQQPRFYAYHFSISGLDTSAVVSDAGAGTEYSVGVLKASPQGNRLFTCGTMLDLELYDFNSSTGMVTNARTIDTVIGYGGVFSPDGSKIYLENPQGTRMLQYDLNQPDPGQTKVVVGTGVSLTDLKLAINHKIYFRSSVGAAGDQYLGCIEAPDNAGTACHFRDSVTSLRFQQIVATQARLSLGLPNDVIVGALPPPAANRVVSHIELCSLPAAGLSLQAASGFHGYEWDNSTNGLMRTITQPGTYWVRYNTFCGPQTDTFKIRTAGLPPLNMTYNRPVLSVNNSFTSYQWYFNGTAIPGATQSTHTVTGDGWYSVLAKKDTSCSDSAAYEVAGFVGINGHPAAEKIFVYPNPARDMLYVKTAGKVSLLLLSPDGRVLLQAPSANSLHIGGLSKGLYFLQIRNSDGILLQTEKILKQE